jgi:hypothetical protein
MKRIAFSTPLAAALGLIVLTNVALLAAAGWNRRGEPAYELSLTERELALPGARMDEGTGLELSLMMTHRAPGVLRRAARWKRHELPSIDYEWLDRAKLGALGFRIDLDPGHPDAAHHYSHAMPRRAYLVLEYDGDAWNRWIAGREEQVEQLRGEVAEGTADPGTLADAEALLALDRTMRSRLFPVDAGLDADALRRRYGDRQRHAVVAGLIRPRIIRDQDEEPVLSGDPFGLVVSLVQVPHTLRQPLEDLLPEENWSELEKRERAAAESGWPSPSPPRYRALMAIGRRHEPWLVDVSREGEDQGGYFRP